LALINLCKLSF